MRFARIEKTILASMFSSEIVRNCSIFLESFPFGIRYPSVNCQHGATDPFFHSARMSVHMRLSSLGHLLYTLYCIPFGPGVEQERAFYTTSVTFFHVGPSMSSGMQCSLTVAIMSQFPSGVSSIGQHVCFLGIRQLLFGCSRAFKISLRPKRSWRS